MKTTTWIAAVATAAIILGACGGGTTATQVPGTSSTGGGTATDMPPVTDAPEATQASGGGGGGGGSKPAGWDQYGKVHIEVTGPVTKSGDYGFIPAGSLFGGAQGSSLNFTVEGTNEIVSIVTGADGEVIVSYGGEDFSMPAAECTTSNWNIGATSGSGSFECTAALVITASGAAVQGGTIKGSFDAHV